MGDKGSSAQLVQTQTLAMQTHPDLVRLTSLKMTKYQVKEKRKKLFNLPPKHLF